MSSDYPHTHQWKFCGSSKIENDPVGYFSSVKARQVFYVSCDICNHLSGKFVKVGLYEILFINGRWKSMWKSMNEPLDEWETRIG